MGKQNNKGVLYILNTPVLTSWGRYEFRPISIDEAREILASEPFVSAVGHEGTARVLTQLLGVEIPENRVRIEMRAGDRALVFRLLVRLPEGKVLGEEELKELPYELGLLEKTGEVEP